MAPIEKKREQILEAAVQEFQERGFQGTSMDRISERANVSKRTVYNHFESKEALFKAIVELIFNEISETLNIVYDPALPLEDQLLTLGRAEGRLMCSKRFMRLARMAMSETIRDPALAADGALRHVGRRVALLEPPGGRRVGELGADLRFPC